MMATTKPTTTSDLAAGTSTSASTGDELSGHGLITDDDRKTAELSVDDRKTSSTTLKGGTKVTGPTEAINKLKNH